MGLRYKLTLLPGSHSIYQIENPEEPRMPTSFFALQSCQAKMLINPGRYTTPSHSLGSLPALGGPAAGDRQSSMTRTTQDFEQRARSNTPPSSPRFHLNSAAAIMAVNRFNHFGPRGGAKTARDADVYESNESYSEALQPHETLKTHIRHDHDAMTLPSKSEDIERYQISSIGERFRRVPSRITLRETEDFSKDS